MPGRCCTPPECYLPEIIAICSQPGNAMTDTHDLKPGDEAAPGTPGTGENICPTCEGKGKVDGKNCATCEGTGKVIEGIGGG
jgi:RecJ-like exonuclease